MASGLDFKSDPLSPENLRRICDAIDQIAPLARGNGLNVVLVPKGEFPDEVKLFCLVQEPFCPPREGEPPEISIHFNVARYRLVEEPKEASNNEINELLGKATGYGEIDEMAAKLYPDSKAFACFFTKCFRHGHAGYDAEAPWPGNPDGYAAYLEGIKVGQSARQRVMTTPEKEG